MLQAHSFLWNYLWVAPNAFLLLVGFLIWWRGLSRQIPAFLAFVILSGTGELATFAADISPAVSAENYWRIVWVTIIVESLLKFVVVGEAFSRVFDSYRSISRIGRILVTGFGAVLVLAAGLIAGFAHGDSTQRLISGAHLIEQTIFVVELGLILFLFILAGYFHLSWDRLSFGILLGLGISSCEHLATWAIIANASPSDHTRLLFAFINNATFHICALIWLYYVAVPKKVATKISAPLPDDNLAIWNRELERLLQS